MTKYVETFVVNKVTYGIEVVPRKDDDSPWTESKGYKLWAGECCISSVQKTIEEARLLLYLYIVSQERANFACYSKMADESWSVLQQIEGKDAFSLGRFMV